MFELIFANRARMAVGANAIASESDFRPTHQEYMEMMSEAFAIVVKISESASREMISSNHESLQDAIRSHSGTLSNYNSTTTTPDDGHARFSNRQRPKNSAESVSRDEVAPASKGNVSVFPLQYQNTEVRLQLLSTDQLPELRVTIPPGTILQAFFQTQTSLPGLDSNAPSDHVWAETQPESHLLDEQLPLPLDATFFPYGDATPLQSTTLGGPDTVDPSELTQNTDNDNLPSYDDAPVFSLDETFQF